MNRAIEIDKEGYARIEVFTPNGPRPTRARILGNFGRHPAMNDKLSVAAWSVTHLPTGRCFGWYFKSTRQADGFMDDVAEFLDAEGVDLDVEDWESAYAVVQAYYTLILNMAADHGALPSEAPRERLPSE